MTRPNISESEWSVMEALWNKAPRTASEVIAELSPATGWAPNTVRTLLTRLVEKGVLTSDKGASGLREFSPLLDRAAVVGQESRSFLDRVFKGAPQSLLVHFASQSDLTPGQVEELKRLLDESLATANHPEANEQL